MEAQRCVWRCLYNSPGAESAEYAACVAAQCSAEPAAAAPWQSGATADGAGFHASAADPVTGNRLSVLCGRGRGAFLGLFGPEGPDATLTLVVDGQSAALAFVRNGEGYYAVLDGRLIEALASGRQAAILNGAGTTLVAVSLDGAAEAIGTARAGCG